MDLSIVIVNWNSKEFIRRCLVSIAAHPPGCAYEIIVIDGASFDGCDLMVSEEFPGVKFVQSPNNIGFGRCNNLGFDHAHGEAVLFLNPDTEVKPGTLQTLIAELGRLPKAGLLGARLLNTDGSLQTSCVRAAPTPLNLALDSDFLRRLFPNSSLWGVGAAFRSTRSIAVEAVSGACMLMRSELFRELSGFRPEYFMYGEDMDICFRVRQRGLKIYHVPSSEIIHHGGGSSRAQVSEFSTIAMRTSASTYMRLNHGRGAERRYRIFQILSAVIRLALLALPRMLLAGSRRASAHQASRKWICVLRWGVGTLFARGLSFPPPNIPKPKEVDSCV